MGKFFYVPVHIAVTPKEGHCWVDRWWAVHPEHGVAFYISGDLISPQCNKNREITEMVIKKILPGCVAQHLPVVFKEQAGYRFLNSHE